MAVIGWITSERFVTETLGTSTWSLYLVPGLTALVIGGLAILEKRHGWMPTNIWWSAILKGAICVTSFVAVTFALERKTLKSTYNVLRRAIAAEST